MKKTTRITELVIDEENEALAIDAISLVTSPALEVDFVFFGKDKNNLTFAKVDEEKRELIAPALIPNKQIYRYDANTDSDYYVYFSKDTVKNAAYSYLKHNNHHKATYQHEQRVSGVLTVESWIKEGDSDKSKLYGFDLPNGSWFVKMKIENSDLWQKIKEGEIKGLSIEGYFVDKLEKMNKTFTDEQIKTAYKELQTEGKIDLGVKDISKLLNEAKQIEKDIIKMTSEAKKTSSILEKTISNVDKLDKENDSNRKQIDTVNKKLNKEFDVLYKSAKDLGIEFDKIPAAKEYYKAKEILKKSSDNTQKAWELVSKYNK